MAYTRLGATVFDWPPFFERSMEARNLWLALYASPQSKKGIPGLFHGGLGALSEAARMGAGPAIEALRELTEAGVAEYDERNRVIRMTQLPDKLEKPANGKVMRMFWNRWKDFPESYLKYRHIGTVFWLCEELLAKVDKPEHQKTWDETFGTVPVDKWSAVDNSLTVSDTVSTATPSQPSLFSATSKEIPTVTTTVELTHQERYKAQSTKHKVSSNGIPSSMTVEDILDAVQRTAAGRVAVDVFAPHVGERLWEVASQCDEQGISIGDIELAGEWLSAGGLSYRDDLDAKWLSYDLFSAVANGRKWSKAGKPALGKKRGGQGGDQSNFDRQAERLRVLRAAEGN
jgi:hypothetical protein